jgi:hypothetical protein
VLKKVRSAAFVDPFVSRTCADRDGDRDSSR